jgi:hypothetical protein
MQNASPKDPELRLWLEHNPALGLWTATITRKGKEVCVIVESTREAVMTEANRLIASSQTHAA